MPISEVRGRCHNCHAEVRTDLHRDHILIYLLAETHTGIIALGYYVGDAIVVEDIRPEASPSQARG